LEFEVVEGLEFSKRTGPEKIKKSKTINFEQTFTSL
jgi:hypothetical protein